MSSRRFFRYPLQKISEWFEKPLAVPIFLFFIAFCSYGLLINRLGYYWDDFPLTYIKNVYGSEGLVRYFSTNRPFWGILYQITYSMFNQPWQWQLNALFWRWISAVILWLLIREIWPSPKYIAIWISLFFLVYPGFNQQHISVIYGNLFIVLDCLLLSLYLNIKAVRRSGGKKPDSKAFIHHLLAIVLSVFNLLALEYFFVLDLLRPMFIWYVLRDKNYNKKLRIKLTLLNWLPYLAVWGIVAFWRVGYFRYQTQNYQMQLLESVKSAPIDALIKLIGTIGTSLFEVFVKAWTQVISSPNIFELGLRTTVGTIIIILFITGITIWFLWQSRKDIHGKVVQWSIIAFGLIACLLGGVPLWLTGLFPAIGFPSDRFTLPFIFGVSLVMIGLISLLPMRSWIKIIILGCLVGIGVGMQFQVVNQFRRDWETQRRFFWQLAWRVPALDHGTTLIVNELPVTYYSDNSLTAPVNWFWAPDNTTQQLAYLLLYPSRRLGKSLVALKPDIPISVDYLAAKFDGNTSKVVTLIYDPPACLRVLDRALDSDNRMLSLEMQAAAALSSDEWIQPKKRETGEILPKTLYAPEPPHKWCYYYEHADLASQQGKWDEVVSIGDVAYNINDYPNDPTEHFPFIEGYAHSGNWTRAYELTEKSLSITPLMNPLLCRLWQRIDETTPDNPEKELTISLIDSRLDCSP